MRLSPRLIFLPLVLLLFLPSCRSRSVALLGTLPAGAGSAPAAATAPPALPVATLVTTVAAATAVPAPTSTPTAVPTLLPTLTAAAPPALTPTPDPYAPYTIDALAARAYGGGELQIVEQIGSTERFARYLITYPSDGLTIYGFMNVPHEGSKFPVALVLHGYVDPDQYQTLAYTTRYADALADAGYFVIHPNLRGFPPAGEGDDAYRTGLAADVLNLIAVIRAQSQDPLGPLRRADADAVHLWGHSMGGGVTLRVATILGDVPYLRAAVLYGAMSGDERLNYERILEWSGGQSGSFELATPPEALQAISPIEHLERLRAPLSIHHGDADETVPPQWSADLCARLEALGHPVECFTYHAAPHTFYGDWEELFNERVIAFFDRN